MNTTTTLLIPDQHINSLHFQPASTEVSTHKATAHHTHMWCLPLFAVSMSIIRPGVQTIISQPRFSSAICSDIPVPPYTQTTCMPSNLENLRHSAAICKASSRVGVMMMAETGNRARNIQADIRSVITTPINRWRMLQSSGTTTAAATRVQIAINHPTYHYKNLNKHDCGDSTMFEYQFLLKVNWKQQAHVTHKRCQWRPTFQHWT